MELNNILTYSLDLLKFCLEELEKKNKEIACLKLKLGEIQNVINSDIKIYRSGKIEINE